MHVSLTGYETYLEWVERYATEAEIIHDACVQYGGYEDGNQFVPYTQMKADYSIAADSLCEGGDDVSEFTAINTFKEMLTKQVVKPALALKRWKADPANTQVKRETKEEIDRKRTTTCEALMPRLARWWMAWFKRTPTHSASLYRMSQPAKGGRKSDYVKVAVFELYQHSNLKNLKKLYVTKVDQQELVNEVMQHMKSDAWRDTLAHDTAHPHAIVNVKQYDDAVAYQRACAPKVGCNNADLTNTWCTPHYKQLAEERIDKGTFLSMAV